MESEAMEGTLWKWTNYFSGWQPRWFVLENGILSYYKSQDDVNNGCKGSIKMAVCDVIVHQTDTTRLDLMIPGEAHFYVKAATPQERQQWLVALGSCKACQNSVRPALSTVTEEITEEEVKSKKSELRLYCDLLMQQVHSVKSAVTEENKGTPDVEKLDGATSLLSATCDTFIKTLDECMRMAQACTPAPGSPGILDNQIPGSPTRPSAKKTGPKGPIQRSMSVDRYIPQRGSTTRISQHSFDETVGRTRIRGGNRSPSESSDPDKMLDLGDPPDKTNDESLEAGGKRQIQTFFSQMPKSFHDIKSLRDGGIPVTTFLDACRAILPIFDKLNPTAFAPVKLDIAGNVRKIQQKYSSNPQEFRTLQQIVLYEINAKQHDQSNSATTALLWLKRGLEFIKEFLVETLVDVEEEDLSIGANRAYGKTLKQYHSWVVRGVFALALKSVPYRKEFIEHMLPDTLRGEESEQVLQEDIKRYTEAMGDVLEIITEFYMKHDLNSQEQV